jgi:hypothetical protein
MRHAMTTHGPYDTEREALAAPLPCAVAGLHDAGQVRPGDPDRLVRNAQLDALHAACTAAGVTLGAFDERILTWLASWEPATTQVIVGIIHRAACAEEACFAAEEARYRNHLAEQASLALDELADLVAWHDESGKPVELDHLRDILTTGRHRDYLPGDGD